MHCVSATAISLCSVRAARWVQASAQCSSMRRTSSGTGERCTPRRAGRTGKPRAVRLRRALLWRVVPCRLMVTALQGRAAVALAQTRRSNREEYLVEAEGCAARLARRGATAGDPPHHVGAPRRGCYPDAAGTGLAPRCTRYRRERNVRRAAAVGAGRVLNIGFAILESTWAAGPRRGVTGGKVSERGSLIFLTMSMGLFPCRLPGWASR